MIGTRWFCLAAALIFLVQCGGGDGAPDHGRADGAADSVTDAGSDAVLPADVPHDVPRPPDGKLPDSVDAPTPPDVPGRPELPDGGEVDGGTPRCVTDEECQDLAPDICHVARCAETGYCAVRPRSCDDGDDCTFDVCNPDSGACAYTPNPECGCLTDGDCPDDTNECAVPFCRIPPGGAFGVCTFVANTTACDDHNPCTESEVCTAVAGPLVAVCGGGNPINCDDADEGTTDWCDPQATPACRTLPLGELAACPNGQSDCPPPSGCIGFVCDGDATNPLCRPTERTGSCADGNFCTEGDSCSGGVCVGGAPRTCDDGDAQTLDSCNPSAAACDHERLASLTPCVTPQDCAAALGPPNDTCRHWLCPQGYCRDVRVPEETSCDDRQFCTVNDSCRQGACVGGVPRNCDDDIPLTDCACDEEEDRCECTEDYRCGTGCTTGSDCSDGDPCTTDSCATYLTPTVCSCRPRAACHCDPDSPDGGAAACDDGQIETEDSCVPNGDPAVPYTGLCEHVLRIVCEEPCGSLEDDATCDDGNKCTVDLCEPSLDEDDPFCCIHPAQGPPCGRACTRNEECADGIACTPDRCGTDGTCDPSGAPLEDCCAADDGCPEDDNPCTTRRCDGSTGRCGFVNNTAVCDDGDVCTVADVCAAGVCRGAARSCSDGDDCTDDRCDPVQGCVSTPAADPPPECVDCRLNPSICDDGDVCTVDYCDPVGLCRHQDPNEGQDTTVCQHLPCRDEVDCDDGNPCTSDQCLPTPADPDGEGPIVPAGGCLYNQDPTCAIQREGSTHPLACTGAQECDPADCWFDDPAAFCNNPTDDCPTALCDAEVGCRFVPTAACPMLECTPATGWSDCHDRNPCTVDECQPDYTCIPLLPTPQPRPPVVLPGNLFRVCQQCEAVGDCEAEGGFALDDPCITLECRKPAQAPEGDTLGVCYAYVDEERFPNRCEDFDLCTRDACLPGGGCAHVPRGADCRLCFGDLDCDDRNPCTTDSCVYESAGDNGLGCRHTPVAGCTACTDHGDCDTPDGSLCGGFQVCDDGMCETRPFTADISQGPVCVQASCSSAEECGTLGDALVACSVDTGDCLFFPARGPCDSVDQCLTTEPCERASACTDGQCVFEPIPSCTPQACTSAAECDDGKLCNVDWCDSGTCLHFDGALCCDSVSDCASQLAPPFRDDCRTRACTPSGTCIYASIDESALCGERCESDGDCERTCTDLTDPGTGAVVGERCESFCLVEGTCSAESPCESGVCDIREGETQGRCLVCYDWPCAEAKCSATGRCVWFTGDCVGCDGAEDCADTDPCTFDSCVAGRCQHLPDPVCTPIACDADTVCDNGDLCQIGVCLSGACVFLPNPACE